MEASLDTGNGSIDIETGLYSAQTDNKLRFQLVNPETGNKVSRVYIDEETGDQFTHYTQCDRLFQIDEDTETRFTSDELKQLKEAALSKKPELQKVVNDSEIDRTRLKGSVYRLKPNEDQEAKYALIHHALTSQDKAIILK